MSNITKVHEIGKEHQVQSTKMDYNLVVQKPEEQIRTHTKKRKSLVKVKRQMHKING